jgi:nucleotide-binding universal stress UspA family protein
MNDEPCVVAAHDGHNPTAVRAAAGLAELLGAHLVIAEVYRHEPGRATLNARRFEAAEAGLRRAVEHVATATEAERVSLPAAHVAPALVHTAGEHRAVALVLGPDQHGHVTHEVLRRADFPVVVTPSDMLLVDDRPQRIGVAFDGSVGSRFALAAARRLAERSGGTVELLAVAHHARDRPALQRLLDDEAQGDERGVLLDGAAGARVRAEAEHLDLLCCGSRARPELLEPVLGSTSSVLVTDPPCPVLVVPPRARASAADALGLRPAGR